MNPSPPQPGVNYLRTLARPKGTWWRLVVSVVLGGVGLFATSLVALVVVILGARLVGFDDYTINEDSLDKGIDAGLLLATNLGLAALIPVAGLLAWWLYGVRPRWISSHRPGLRWGWLWVCAAIASVVWVLLGALGTVGALVTRDTPVGSAVLGFIVVVLLTTPLQAAGEEYLFRGLLLQSLGAAKLPEWACCVISAGLFAAAHLQFQPELLADRFVVGLAFAWVAVKTGGLEASIALHAVKNVAVFIPAAFQDDLSAALDPQNVSYLPAVVDIVLLGIALPWMLHVAKKRKSRGQWEPPDQAEPPAQPVWGAPPGWPPPPPPGWTPPPGWPPPGWPPPPPPGWPGPPPPGWRPPPGPR